MSGVLVARDVAEAERFLPAWDALAVAAARPYCAPAWLLAWWRHVAPPAAELRLVLLTDGDALAGVAPFCAGRGGAWRLLGSGTCTRVEPLAAAGRERELATAIAAAAREDTPAVLLFEGIPAGSPWPGLVGAAWGVTGQPWRGVQQKMPAPTLDLRGLEFEPWLDSKSASFRKQMRRVRRQLDARGATFRLAETEPELARGVRAFVDLHTERWAARGGSAVVSGGVEGMLAEAGAALVADSRLRVWTIDVEDRTISAQLFLAAGGEVAYWLGGFDDAWAAQQPAHQAVLAAIEHAVAAGDLRLELGAGDQPYKYRFADGEERLEWVALVPPGRRRPATRMRLAAQRARRQAADRVPPAPKARLKRALARLGLR